MSYDPKDGGPAFPAYDGQAVHAVAMAATIHIEDATERERAYIVARGQAVQGMSLRDYFAAHAPAVPDDFRKHYATGSVMTEPPHEREIRWRWAYADQMLKARKA